MATSRRAGQESRNPAAVSLSDWLNKAEYYCTNRTLFKASNVSYFAARWFIDSSNRKLEYITPVHGGESGDGVLSRICYRASTEAIWPKMFAETSFGEAPFIPLDNDGQLDIDHVLLFSSMTLFSGQMNSRVRGHDSFWLQSGPLHTFPKTCS